MSKAIDGQIYRLLFKEENAVHLKLRKRDVARHCSHVDIFARHAAPDPAQPVHRYLRHLRFSVDQAMLTST